MFQVFLTVVLLLNMYIENKTKSNNFEEEKMTKIISLLTATFDNLLTGNIHRSLLEVPFV